jgi:hypothetical protein
VDYSIASGQRWSERLWMGQIAQVCITRNAFKVGQIAGLADQ